MNEKTVGEAYTAREGAQILICCACNNLPIGKYRLFVRSRKERLSLGLLAPESGAMTLKKRVSRKQLDMSDLEFWLNGECQTQAYFISETEPFEFISLLHSCALAEDGRLRLITDRSISQQDNDPSQEHQNI